MQIRKLSILLALTSIFAMGAAFAQESDDSTTTDGTNTDRQRPDREEMRKRRENMSDEEKQAMRERRQQRSKEHRAAKRERWESMSDEERQAARDRRHERRSSKDGHGHRGQRGGKQSKGES